MTRHEHPPATAVTQPNPQGKGLVPVLQDWADLRARGPGAKTAAVFLRDYVMSSLVLAASFSFKPVVGKHYFLYVRDGDWTLSLVSPGEWGSNKPGDFLGRCTLRSDMTWELQSSGLEEDSRALVKAREFVQEFVVGLAGRDSISEGLPVYVRELPYYRRMLSTALSSSLRQSLPPSGDGVKALLRERAALSLVLGS